MIKVWYLSMLNIFAGHPVRRTTGVPGVENLCRPASGPRAWRPCGPGRVATGREGCSCLLYSAQVQQRRHIAPGHLAHQHPSDQPHKPSTTALPLTRNDGFLRVKRMGHGGISDYFVRTVTSARRA
jgi:hypothetical protein